MVLWIREAACRIHENNSSSGPSPVIPSELGTPAGHPGQTILRPGVGVAGKKDLDFPSQPPPHWLP